MFAAQLKVGQRRLLGHVVRLEAQRGEGLGLEDDLELGNALAAFGKKKYFKQFDVVNIF